MPINVATRGATVTARSGIRDQAMSIAGINFSKGTNLCATCQLRPTLRNNRKDGELIYQLTFMARRHLKAQSG